MRETAVQPGAGPGQLPLMLSLGRLKDTRVIKAVRQGAVGGNHESFDQHGIVANVAVVQCEQWALNHYVYETILANVRTVIQFVESVRIVESKRRFGGIRFCQLDGHPAMSHAPAVESEAIWCFVVVVNRQPMFVAPQPDELLSLEKFGKLFGRFG